MDPCELRLAKGDDAVADLVQPRTPLFEFALRQILGRYDLETPAGRAPRWTRPRRSSPASRTAVPSTRSRCSSRACSASSTPSSWSSGWRSSPVGRVTGAGARRRPGTVPRSPTRRLPPGGDGSGAEPPQPVYATERELLKLALQRPELVSPAFDAYGSTSSPRSRTRRSARRSWRPAGAEYGGRTLRSTWSACARRPRRHGARHGDGTGGRGDHAPQGGGRDLRGRPVGHGPPPRRRTPHPRRPEHADRLGAYADPAHLSAVQNELWVLQQYDQALRERGPRRCERRARSPGLRAGRAR